MNNKNKLEGHLGNLIGEIQDSQLGLSQFIYENQERCQAFIKALYKNDYICENYSLEAIIEILDYTFTQNFSSVKQLIDAFEVNLKNSYNEWVVIFPLNYNKLPTRSSCSFFERSVEIGRYIIIPPRNSVKNFKNFYIRKYRSYRIESRILEHQIRVSNGHILSSPLLSFHIHGSWQIASARGLYFYNFFLWLQNLYIALLGKRDATLNLSQDISIHYFLLNLKNGEIDRFPIHVFDENRIFGRLDNELLKSIRSKNFSRNANFIFSRNDKLFRRIYNSLHFFSKGFISTDSVSRILFYIISLESIFSRDKNTPLRATLADYVSLLCVPPSQRIELRIELHKKIQKLYDVRSSIVHQGVHHVAQDMVDEAEQICAQAISNVIEMYAKYEIQSDLEKRFFDDLLKLKLTRI